MQTCKLTDWGRWGHWGNTCILALRVRPQFEGHYWGHRGLIKGQYALMILSSPQCPRLIGRPLGTHGDTVFIGLSPLSPVAQAKIAKTVGLPGVLEGIQADLP